jgi:hypothetical protein
MRKLEGVVKEIVSEMDYLKRREERFSGTNGELHSISQMSLLLREIQSQRIDELQTLASSHLSRWWLWEYGKSSTCGRISSENIS